MTVHYHDAQWGQSEIASLFSLMYNFTRKILIFLKAELLQVDIFFLIHLFAWEILLLKKLEIEETKTV